MSLIKEMNKNIVRRERISCSCLNAIVDLKKFRTIRARSRDSFQIQTRTCWKWSWAQRCPTLTHTCHTSRWRYLFTIVQRCTSRFVTCRTSKIRLCWFRCSFGLPTAAEEAWQCSKWWRAQILKYTIFAMFLLSVLLLHLHKVHNYSRSPSCPRL